MARSGPEMGSKMAIWMDRKFRDDIHKRDNWRCRMCGLGLGREATDAVPVLGKIKAIAGEGLYGKARTFEINHQPENLMTLCLPCQKKNTARLSAERIHGIKRLKVDGRTYERILKESVKRGFDLEKMLIVWMDTLAVPGLSGITGDIYLADGTRRGKDEVRKPWTLEQKPRPEADRGTVGVEPGEIVSEPIDNTQGQAER